MRFLVCGASTLQSQFDVPSVEGGQRYGSVASTLDVGGLAPTVARTISALGHEASLLTLLGDTPAAEIARSILLEDEVDVEDLAGVGSPGLSTVIRGVDPTVVSDGEDIREAAFPDASVLEGVSALIIDTSLPSIQIPLARQASQAGIPVICHLETDSAEAKILIPVTTHVILTPRFTTTPEATSMEICSEIFYRGTSFAARTNGPDTVTIAADEQGYEMPVPSIENVVDTYGASEVLTGGFAVSLADGTDPLQALIAGAQLAAVSVTYPGPLGWARAFQER